ncbi:MAG: hypothetical protein RL117_1127 [Verrucomicrobiota bacterium]|jgi:uncharacterized RDD family membrane protein YckC
MKVWIIIDGEKAGPFEISHVVREIEAGHFTPEMHGWMEGMREWQPLASMPSFAEVCAEKKELEEHLEPLENDPFLEKQNPPPLPPEMDPAVRSPLLRRFFARWFDLFLWSSLYLCAMQLSGAPLKQMMMNFWFNYLMMIVWLLIEASMIHVWGTTPGKALLGVRVITIHGDRLSVGASLLRAVRVYLMGMGMSHPVLMPLCHGFSWWFVRKHGAALWDGSPGFHVTIKRIRASRWFLYLLLVFTIMNISGLVLEPVSRELFREMFPEQSQWLENAENAQKP